jgi:hypothetical protein
MHGGRTQPLHIDHNKHNMMLTPPKSLAYGKRLTTAAGCWPGLAPSIRIRKDYMWFGTFCGGLCRYDGVEFVHYTSADGLVDNRVYQIALGHDGRMWCRLWDDL